MSKLNYIMKAAFSKRKIEKGDYWKTSSEDINKRCPLFKGAAMVVHSPAGCGKTKLMQRLLKDIPEEVFKVVILIDERSDEALDYEESSDSVINLPTEFREYGPKFMWDSFIEAYKSSIGLAMNEHKDVLIVIDSLSRLSSIASEAGIVPKGNTVPGGVDENAINKVKTYMAASGNYIDGGSLTVWGTCILQNSNEALSKGASAILNGVSKIDIVLNRDHEIDPISLSRHSYLLKDKKETKSNGRDFDPKSIFRNGIVPSTWKKSKY